MDWLDLLVKKKRLKELSSGMSRDIDGDRRGYQLPCRSLLRNHYTVLHLTPMYPMAHFVELVFNKGYGTTKASDEVLDSMTKEKTPRKTVESQRPSGHARWCVENALFARSNNKRRCSRRCCPCNAQNERAKSPKAQVHAYDEDLVSSCKLRFFLQTFGRLEGP